MSTTSLVDVAPKFQDKVGKTEIPAATMHSALTALKLLGVDCSYDVFHDKRIIGGQVLGSEVGQVSDDVCLLIRELCRQRFKFDPGVNPTWDAINLACRLNSFHPVVDYLDSVKWDGKKRIGTWLHDYMKAPDTPFVRAVGELVLVASVRRVRQPGCKYDYMVVLESGEGTNKSKALAMLYGAENFSDQSILGVSDRELQEAFRGRWGVEAADLSGMRKAEVEKVKAQITRQEDRGRPAYGRAVINVPRTVVPWGTTNDAEYLRSQTGNRRFLPTPVGRIDITALMLDRDQLWAEAAFVEDLGGEISLPENLWRAAAIEQNKRTMGDPWQEEIESALADVERHEAERAAAHNRKEAANPFAYYEDKDDGERRITSHFLLSLALGIKAGQQSAECGKRVGVVMRKLGWVGPEPLRIGGRVTKGYRLPSDPLA
ncbi:MAG TPA: virulence-associated E family protein [Xanthobacteraceae bacterium]|nr:virulence-associated E family protein [Xanthobacteraceae bacterium]